MRYLDFSEDALKEILHRLNDLRQLVADNEQAIFEVESLEETIIKKLDWIKSEWKAIEKEAIDETKSKKNIKKEGFYHQPKHLTDSWAERQLGIGKTVS